MRMYTKRNSIFIYVFRGFAARKVPKHEITTIILCLRDFVLMGWQGENSKTRKKTDKRHQHNISLDGNAKSLQFIMQVYVYSTDRCTAHIFFKEHICNHYAYTYQSANSRYIRFFGVFYTGKYISLKGLQLRVLSRNMLKPANTKVIQENHHLPSVVFCVEKFMSSTFLVANPPTK
jgi:hypothetical protein